MQKLLTQKNIIYLSAGLVLLIAIILSIYFFSLYQSTRSQLLNPSLYQTNENKKVLENLGKIMTLPQNETPSFATVADVDKLKDQPFFANAKTGDKVIVFQNAKKAILYDPVKNKIVEVAPISIASNSATPSTTQNQSIKVALYNGTKTVGITSNAEKFLKDKMGSQIEIVLKESAKNQNYEKTAVVDLSKINSAIAQKIAQNFNSTLTDLPQGENKPVVSGSQVDVLVIIGRDFPEK